MIIVIMGRFVHDNCHHGEISVSFFSPASVEQLVEYFAVNPDEDLSHDLRDNRDLQVMYSWDPNNTTQLEENKKQSFEEEVSIT